MIHKGSSGEDCFMKRESQLGKYIATESLCGPELDKIRCVETVTEGLDGGDVTSVI